MRTSNRSVFRHWSRRASVTARTAVYGPVCTVVWQGSAGDRRPYADQTASWEVGSPAHGGIVMEHNPTWSPRARASLSFNPSQPPGSVSFERQFGLPRCRTEMLIACLGKRSGPSFPEE